MKVMCVARQAIVFTVRWFRNIGPQRCASAHRQFDQGAAPGVGEEKPQPRAGRRRMRNDLVTDRQAAAEPFLTLNLSGNVIFVIDVEKPN